MIDNITPLDWHNLRFLDFIPDHFTTVKYNHMDDHQRAMEWLSKNITGRYGIAEDDQNEEARSNQWLSTIDMIIGFENPADATMYTMFFK